jgi:hypothetical protein
MRGPGILATHWDADMPGGLCGKVKETVELLGPAAIAGPLVHVGDTIRFLPSHARGNRKLLQHTDQLQTLAVSA